MMKVGIIGAMDEEIEDLLQFAGKTEKKDGFIECTLGGVEAIIVRSGIGKVNAALTAQRLISDYKVDYLINTGVAGAIDSRLRVLDLVISTDALYHDFDAVGFGYKPTVIPRMKESDFKADKKLQSYALKAFESLKDAELFKGHQAISGRIASGDQYISEQSVKDHIIELCHPACVEMEGAAIAHTAYLNQVPFVIIRCMSDTADKSGDSTIRYNEHAGAKISATLVYEMLKEISRT